MFDRKRLGPEYWKGEVLEVLLKPGCLVCVKMLDSLDRYFFWFIHEQYNATETRRALRRSYGFCPLHTRHFLAWEANWCGQPVYSYVIEHIVARLREAQSLLCASGINENSRKRCVAVAAALAPSGKCPVCENLAWWCAHMANILLQTLSDREVEEAYAKSQGLCLPHFRFVGLRAGWEQLLFLADHLKGTLASLKYSTDKIGLPLEVIAGLDVHRRVRSSEETARGLPGGAREKSTDVLALLAGPACPACAACDRGVGEYFQWLASEMEAVASRAGPWDPSWSVCASHLCDLQSAGHDRAAATISDQTCSTWLNQSESLKTRLEARQPDRISDRLAGLSSAWARSKATTGEIRSKFNRLWHVAATTLESPANVLNRLREVYFRESPCQACSHVEVTAHRTIDLVLRVLEDPIGREAYHRGAGLCFRHCLVAANLAEVPDVLDELFASQLARLRLLEWELEEASRKMNWVIRYEPKGPEETSWRRAAYQLCGSALSI
ncbi:MAG: hypothetical protein HY284_06645 [Nitrospirae bacterium]|nr:hypothetical protein [Nitrospirota bacterium]